MDGGASPHDGSESPEHRSARPVAPQQRQWTHPSEAGLNARVETDRRRSRVLVVGLVALGTGVLVATAVFAAGRDQDPGESAAATAELMPNESVALVEMADNPGRGPVTGVVVDDGSHVLVSGVDVEDAEEVTVRVDGERSTATMSAKDQMSGLVLLRIDGPAARAPEMGTEPPIGPEATAGESVRLLHFGADEHLHSHRMTVKSTDADMMRPDDSLATGLLALTGPSDEPGPLMDAEGRLTGWVVDSGAGTAMAYTAESLMLMVDELIERGQVGHGWIGIRAAAAEPAGSGALVIEVHHDTPAEAAGIEAGDLIVAVGENSVTDLKDLVSTLDRSGPGGLVRVDLLRDGRAQTLTVTVGEHPGEGLP